MKKIIPFLLLFLPSLSWAAPQAIPAFRGLHDSESPMLIKDEEAQAIQDVDITESGNGIKKREGYALFKTIGVSTVSVRGGYYFRTTGGNDLIIHANNASVFKSAAGGNYASFITTDTAFSYYDFADSQGFLYRATNNRDQFARYDGTTLTYFPSNPQGDQVEALADRLVLSGTTANPNRVHFSEAADFTNFTVGSEETDPFTEDIALPGQKVNAIKVACGSNVLAWTRDTTSMVTAQNQYDSGPTISISNTIGTLQPSSVIQDYGITFWQGQDKHFYAYDCNTVTQLSQSLDVSNFAGGETKQWEQTSEEDWEDGTLTELSADISVGDVVLSTWTDTDTTTADFTAGAVSNTSIISNRVYLSTNNTDLLNPDFETTSGSFVSNWTAEGGVQRTTNYFGGLYVIGPKSGVLQMYLQRLGDSTKWWPTTGVYIEIRDSSNVLIESQNLGLAIENLWIQKTITLSNYAGRFIRIAIGDNAGQMLLSDVFLCSGNNLTLWVNAALNSGLSAYTNLVDLVSGGRSTTYSGTFTSAAFDTALSSPVWIASGANWTTNSNVISMQTQSSADSSSWETAVTWSTGSAPTSSWQRYIRYVMTVSTGGTTNGTALPFLDDATFSARQATGTFVSPTRNIGGNATAFRNFTATDDTDSGTIAYFLRTATTEGGLSAASYVALTKDSQITASINPWIQFKATFTITAATQDPTLSNAIIAWDEGTLVRTFGIVDSDHRLMWSVAEGTNTVPNATYIYDPRFASWLRYAVPFDAPAKVGDSIYFGNPSSGNVYNWPSGDTDNGAAITAYWKSKDFISGDPFVEKDFMAYSLIANEDIGSNLDVTYTINLSSSITNNHSLTDPAGTDLRRINAKLPSGKFGTFISFQFGNDDANAPFELYGFKYDYNLRPWRVMQ